MRKYVLFLGLYLFVFSSSNGQIITTIAGNGILGDVGDGGPATMAELNHPNGLAIDAIGNIFISDYFNNRIRKISTDGIIRTIAGNGSGGFFGDGGPATAAVLNGPVGIVLDNTGNIYFADANNHRIRKINTAGIINTIAGSGSTGSSGDGGPATAAKLDFPFTLALDAIGNIYIGDFLNNKVRKVTTGGIISTIAGTGAGGYSGDNGSATDAKLRLPYGLIVRSNGDIYFDDYGNSAVRKINTSNIITTVVGNGVAGFNGDSLTATATKLNLPEGIVFDSIGNLYIVDMINQRIRKVDTFGTVTTIAGTGTAGYDGDGGMATNAKIDSPVAIVFDQNYNLCFADYQNNVIRKIAFAATGLQTLDKTTSFQIAIYPNPTTSTLTINSSQPITEITITNLVGQVITSSKVNQKEIQIDVSYLPNGLYFLIVNGTEVKRFLKE